MSDEFSFKSFLEDEQQQEADTNATEGVQTTEQPEQAEQPVEAAEQEAPVSQPEGRNFEDVLRERGFAVDADIDREDLYNRLADSVQSGLTAQQEAAQLRQQLEQLQAQAASQQTAPQPAPQGQPVQQQVQQHPQEEPVGQAPAGETAEETGKRLFRELKTFDRSLLRLVEEGPGGEVVPIAEYGKDAIDAADTINSYYREQARQADMLVSNPSLLIQEHMPDIEKLVEKKASELYQKEREAWEQKTQAERAEAQRRAEEERQLAEFREFHEQNKAKFFRLSKSGEPLRDTFNPQEYLWTPMGRYFQERAAELARRLPESTPAMTIYEIAKQQAELAFPNDGQSTPTQTQAQKKQFLAGQNGTAQPQVPNGNTNPASAEQMYAAQPTMSFADMVRNDPDNQDIIANWR